MNRIDVDTTNAPATRSTRVGVAHGVAAYVWWGLVPIYFKAVTDVPALEVLAHRILWSVLLLAVWLRLRGRWSAAIAALVNPRAIVTLLVTTVLIAGNWYVFIWAVDHNEVLQSSLGYFINPLVNVLLGLVFLRERLRRWQAIAVVLAAAGVLHLTIAYGRFPWIALYLATSFGFYGLLRKTAPVDAPVGLTVETALLLPFALAYMAHAKVTGNLAFGASTRGMDLLLVLAGVVTALPLLWFTNAARRLRLVTLGFLQYLAPTGHFLLAVCLYREPFTAAHGVAFACIWAALAIYSIDTARGALPGRRNTRIA